MDPWQLNIRHLSAFVAICDHGSISAAAPVVNLSQPAVTQGIAKLEAQLDAALFSRLPSGMEMTNAAVLFLPRARAALAQISSKRITSGQVRAFLALSHAGSYSAAAKQTGLTEPSLHRAVGDLSLAMGRDLVERRGRSVSLTRQGQKFARQAGLAASEIRSAIAELAALAGREVGRISIGAMPLVRARVLPAALAEFHREFPSVNLNIVEGSHAELIGPLRDGDIDIMLGALRGVLPQDGLTEEILFIDRPVIMARAGHPLAERKTTPSWDELAGYEWVVAPPEAPLHGLWRSIFESIGLVAPKVPIECGSVITIRQLLLSDDYLTLLSPDQLAVELQAGLIKQICPSPDYVHRDIGICSRADWQPTRMQQALIEMLKEHSKN